MLRPPPLLTRLACRREAPLSELPDRRIREAAPSPTNGDAQGLSARYAGLPGHDPGHDLGDQQPDVRVRIGNLPSALWTVSTSGADDAGELDRSVLAGEAAGRWLWVVLRPASAVLLMRDDWILRDVSAIGPPLIETPFGGPAPLW